MTVAPAAEAEPQLRRRARVSRVTSGDPPAREPVERGEGGEDVRAPVGPRVSLHAEAVRVRAARLQQGLDLADDRGQPPLTISATVLPSSKSSCTHRELDEGPSGSSSKLTRDRRSAAIVARSSSSTPTAAAHSVPSKVCHV